MKRFTAVSMACLLLFLASAQHTVVFGQTTIVNGQDMTQGNLEDAAWPAVAAVAYGAVLVGAFAYGVYKGWQEASEGSSLEQMGLMEKDDAFRYNLSVLEYQQYSKMDFSAFDG